MTNSTYIALLRGINVGGRNIVAMTDLRTLCEELGWMEVRTYIQSGNVVFRAASAMASLAEQLEDGIQHRFERSLPVIVRSGGDWRAYLEANPFPDASASQPNLVMLGLSSRPPNEDAAERLQERATSGERVLCVGDAIWIHFPGGSGRSKLTPGLLDKHVGSPVTTRNWRTVVKLGELATEVGQSGT